MADEANRSVSIQISFFIQLPILWFSFLFLEIEFTLLFDFVGISWNPRSHDRDNRKTEAG